MTDTQPSFDQTSVSVPPAAPVVPAPAVAAPDPVAALEAATDAAIKAAAQFAGAVIEEVKAYNAMLSGAQLERAAHFLALQALAEAYKLTQTCSTVREAAQAAFDAAK